jgi:hypothetical protein
MTGSPPTWRRGQHNQLIVARDKIQSGMELIEQRKVRISVSPANASP